MASEDRSGYPDSEHKEQDPSRKGKELDQDLQARKNKAEEERKGLEGLNKLHKEKESELKQSQEKLRKAKERLLEVKTNKEYQAMLTEIDTIEKEQWPDRRGNPHPL